MRPARPNVLARAGAGAWRLLTSVNFAVLQIIVLGIFGVIGMTMRQLPGFAFRSATDYADQMALIHQRYDGVLGSRVVDILESLQVFHVFSSWWFSGGLVLLLISIVVCTIDRTPRLWQQVSDVRVVQPDAYFDPGLPDRAAMTAVPGDGLREVLRRHRFRVREEAVDGVRYLYGDRNQYMRMATLLTHTGLVLFLVAAAVTSRFGYEAGLVIPGGETATVQPIGTPGLLVVKNFGFQAPGLETGRPTDFTTDLAVYRDGQQIARKTIRVNDPLSVAGYTFHQNGFGPALDLVIRDPAGKLLWSGPVAMTGAANGLPFEQMSVPGRDVGLQLLLQKQPDGTGAVLILPFRVTGTNADGTPQVQDLYPMAVGIGAVGGSPDVDFTVELRGVGAYTLLIAKQDPGQGLVWLAFLSLISGLVISFYLPRRRVWTRLSPDGELRICGRADRYVDFEREFGRLLDDLVAIRRPEPAGPGPAPGA